MARDDEDLDEPIKAGIQAALLDVHTQLRGVVVSYDEDTHKCEIKVGTKLAVPDGKGGVVYQSFPNLTHVPVAWPSAGGFMLHWPLPAGSSVFVTFDEQDAQQWETNGQVSEPKWLERHGLASALAHPYARTPVATSGANMPCPSPFSFGNAAAAKVLAVAELVSARLDAIQTKFDAHTHTVATTGTASAQTGTAAAPASPIGTLAPVACAKLKAE
jgi:hypothetical protein